MSTPSSSRDIYSVSRLNQEVRGLIEAHLPLVWVEGEISNLARPASGHIYFSLKDAAAQVRCAMFRPALRLIGFRPENGAQVLARGRASLYPGRGDFQIIVDYLEEAGAGALRRAFELLKRRLEAEGLFAPERKRPLPVMPACIGVVTSPSGAAIRDIVSVVRRRWPGAALIVYPVPVQGTEAAAAICKALAVAAERAECDVLLLTRGGGSLEDLQPFNEERVARAVAACPIPVVTGVGHEVDFTIVDFVVDRRAATPSAAAELVTPDLGVTLTRLHGVLERLRRRAVASVGLRRSLAEALLRRLRHPRRRLEDTVQRLDGLQMRLQRAAASGNTRRWREHAALAARLAAAHPGRALRSRTEHLARLRTRLDSSARRATHDRRLRLDGLRRALQAIGPLATLERGYSIVLRAGDGSVVRDAAKLERGERLDIRLAAGGAAVTVDEVLVGRAGLGPSGLPDDTGTPE